MKKGIWKRRAFAFLVAAAMVIPQGVYAAEIEGNDEPENVITEEVPEKLHEEGCTLPSDYEGTCVVSFEESIVDEAEVTEDTSSNADDSEQKEMAKKKMGLTEDEPMEVPAEALIVVSGTYYGISKDWFEENNPNKETLFFSIEIPDSVTKIANDGFRSSYTNDKKKYGAVTTNDKLGDYKVVSIDFSNATSLETIDSQAAMGVSLQGVLDLSKTSVKNIGKSAFSGCTGLTGVILPDTLEVLGAVDGKSGSVFNDCTGLQFVRTASSDTDTVFELPSNLRVIGKDTFKDTFSNVEDIIVRIPASVDIIGSQAFYDSISTKSCFSQIYIERPITGGYEGYDTRAFTALSTGNRLLVFPSSADYKNEISFTRINKTYPVTLKFENNVEPIEQKKLYGQSIGYEYDAGKWVLNEDYELPEVPETEKIPGYDVGWKINGDTKILTNTSIVRGLQTDELKVEIDNHSIVSKPTVQYKVENQIMEDTSEIPYTVEFSENQPAYVGVEVTHPLATEEAKANGTYVYYKYCWWDLKDSKVNGPRSMEEPNLFSNAIDSGNYNRVYTDQTMIPMYKNEHTRIDGNYYLVEIYGYYVENNGAPKQYYKSRHNFIAGDNATANECYLMEVDVREKAQEYFDVTATANEHGSINPSGIISIKKGENQTFTITPDSGYIIADVFVDGISVGAVKSYTFENVTANHTISATFERKSDGGSSSSGGSHASNTYYVRYHNDDDTERDGKFIPGEEVTVKGNVFVAPVGKVLAGWSLEEDGKVDYKAGDTFRMPGSSVDLYAVWKDAETESHSAYISGYPDGTVGPDKTITRAEAATMFYNLLADENGDAKTFADVPANQWYAKAVTTLAGNGVISGYPDGTFKPNAPITRAEFVTMAMNFAKAGKGTVCSFPDVPQDMWYYGAIAGGTQNGWISGYPDGTFGPDRYITRAEVTSVINRMENRAADMSFMMEHLDEMRTFSDLGFGHWAYGSMMEAANGHDYTKADQNSYESWVDIH